MTGRIYARTAGPQELWELLPDHLHDVGSKASDAAGKFGAASFGLAAGLLHDLGKAKREFQDYMCEGGPRVGHSTEGARFAAQYYCDICDKSVRAPIGRLIAAVIAGHHSGLSNLDERFGTRLLSAAKLPSLLELPKLEVPKPLVKKTADPFVLSFFTRMLFSALVDADRLVSEQADERANKLPSKRLKPRPVAELKPLLDAHLAERFPVSDHLSDLARLRAEVLEDCRAAATLKPGLFSLTVPTGGGKTLSSLAFALDHAKAYGLDRVIYVIPFTSIIDQTADVFRRALGDADSILEHHSAFDDEALEKKLANEGKSNEGKEALEKLRLAMQNWDRPIVVTTAVQFFESLYAASPKRCRKLHNMARSVIVLDEAQTLPLSLLRPCLAAMKELARGYGSSIVLCTATQPALTDAAFQEAARAARPPPEALKLGRVREIVRRDRGLEGRLQRVTAQRAAAPLSDDDLSQALASEDKALVIVNNRRHARDLFGKLEAAGVAGIYHLTTAMTAAHRQHRLAHIGGELKSNRPVRAVSTSLIEAGVDISFAAVWRAIAGLDQIVQAAGRCNREGELGPLGGRLTIFAPEDVEGHGAPRELAQNAAATESALAKGLDPLSSAAVSEYFHELLWRRNDDGRWAALDDAKVGDAEVRGIIQSIRDDGPELRFAFADIAAAFHMIEETMVPVIIPKTAHAIAGVDESELTRLADFASAGAIAREAQRHIVQVPRRARGALIKAGSAYALKPETYGEQFVLLTNKSLYTDETGLNWGDPTYRDVVIL